MRGRAITEPEAQEMRAHLTRVALRIVDTEGRDTCSLRRVGVEAGISRTTPYTYFADKEALLDAVRVAALHVLSDGCEAALREGATVADRLAGVGRAYIQFALSHPTLYDLVFDAHTGGPKHEEAAFRYRQLSESPLREAFDQILKDLAFGFVPRARCAVSRWRKAARLARWAGLILVLAGLVVAWNVGTLVRLVMTPAVLFDLEIPPPAPDYADPRSWSALPERDDLADRSPAGTPAVDQRHASVDVFYLHPTSYIGSRWNAAIEDMALNEATDRVATGIQASAFSGCCAEYAPRYRRPTRRRFYLPSTDGERAIALAYIDVKRAFGAFNARRGLRRPFILASHSQGAVLPEQREIEFDREAWPS